MTQGIIELDQVQHVARLARLALTDAELEPMTKELSAILGYMALLDELDTTDVEPTCQVVIEALPLRTDEARPGLSREVVLGQSPNSSNDGFAVPAFVED